MSAKLSDSLPVAEISLIYPVSGTAVSRKSQHINGPDGGVSVYVGRERGRDGERGRKREREGGLHTYTNRLKLTFDCGSGAGAGGEQITPQSGSTSHLRY